MGDSKSGIDVIFADQPNLFHKSGVPPSLHREYYYQITYGKVTLGNITPSPIVAEFGIWIAEFLYFDAAFLVKFSS